ncbi:MAG: hypothetical protein LH702_14680 [Phormidesmis sp. CAN_BIN44]|nr:hypothetical protein [Phormidesmis sp. CAN_BIN44]
MLKPKKIASIVLFATLGAGYFATFSNLEINFFLRNYLILVPAQLGVLIYLFGWRRNSPSAIANSEKN